MDSGFYYDNCYFPGRSYQYMHYHPDKYPFCTKAGLIKFISLLTNELNAAANILDEVVTAIQNNSDIKGKQLSRLQSEFKQECSKARHAWALAVFSEQSESNIKRYFTYHLQIISGFAEKIDLRNDSHSPEPCDNNFSNALKRIFSSEVYFLLDHLLDLFGKYLDTEVYVPISYSIYCISKQKMDADFIINQIKNKPITPSLLKAVSDYILKLSGGTQFLNITFSQLYYFQDFIREMRLLCRSQFASINDEQLARKLLELEFNHLMVFKYYQQDILRGVNGKNALKSIKFLQQKLQSLKFYGYGKKQSMDHHWPSLSIMLTEWLSEEIAILKNSTQQSGVSVTGLNKIRLELSVAHLACLLKFLNKQYVFGPTSRIELFKFFSENFSTKRTERISPGGLSKEYYSINQVTAAEIKDLLSKMIHGITREFFPVVVAIGITIAFH